MAIRKFHRREHEKQRLRRASAFSVNKDISATIASLNSKRIFCEKYDFLPQDGMGVWTSPNGSKVAWFKDPDGNILSLTE